jgi:protein-tyrosine-phosphatase
LGGVVHLRQLADSVEVASAGTIAAERPDPGVVTLMAEDGVDIFGARPKLLDPAVAARADCIISMGCDVEGVPRVDLDIWIGGCRIPRDSRPNAFARFETW